LLRYFLPAPPVSFERAPIILSVIFIGWG
jgi:hypothetical protein